MRRYLLCLVLIGCSSKTPPASPATVSNTSKPSAPSSLNEQGSAFLAKMLEAAAAGEDCDKFASALEALAPDAKALREQLVAANQKFIDLTLEPDLVQRAKAGQLEQRILACSTVGSRTSAALDATVDVVDPEEERDMGWGVRGRGGFGQGK